MASTKTRGHRIKGKGPFIYKDFRDNHVIWPGTEPRLDGFLGQSFKGINHKRKNARSSNSEDALTWSCFEWRPASSMNTSNYLPSGGMDCRSPAACGKPQNA